MQERYKKKIDWVFFNEKKIEKAVYAARVDNPRPEVPVISQKNFSDPTANSALHNLTPLSSVTIAEDSLSYPELWLIVISKTYNWCRRQSDTYEQAIRKKYLGLNYIKICHELHISQTTLKNYIERARQYAALQAAQFHLIYVD